MKMKRGIVLLLVCSLLLTLATGCSSKSKDQGEKGSQSTSSVKGKDSSTNKENITLRFTYWGSPIEKRAVVESIRQFEEKYDYIKVTAMHVPADYETKITTMLAGGEAPDVAYLGGGTAMQWATEGTLYNILDFINEDPEINREDLIESVWYDYGKGKSLGTNTAVESIGLFYNKDMFIDSGVELPPTKSEDAWTWDEFVEVCKLLTIDRNGNNATSPDFNPQDIKQYGIQLRTSATGYMNMVHSNGGDYLNEDGTALGLTEPEALEAIQKMADLINVHHVAPSPIQQKNIPDPAIALQTKQVAMQFTGQWILLDLGKAAEETGFNFGVGVLPKLKKPVTVVLGGATVIFKDTKHPDESWLLYKWLANPESSLDLHRGGLWMPLMKEWYTNEDLLAKWAMNNPAHPEGYVDAVVNQTMENGVSGPSYTVKNFAKIDAVISPALEQVWLGEKSAEEALKEVENQVNELVDGYFESAE